MRIVKYLFGLVHTYTIRYVERIALINQGSSWERIVAKILYKYVRKIRNDEGDKEGRNNILHS